MNWLKQLFTRHRLYRDLDEEVAFHLEQKVEELMATGLSREQAVATAHREFGNVAHIKQTAREAWGWNWLEDLLVDVRFSTRMLRKNPVLNHCGRDHFGAGNWRKHRHFHAAVRLGATKLARGEPLATGACGLGKRGISRPG
ncbi:MAG: permease prefix domain 1-containing protein [Candidatus Acidiferrum sp.]